MSSTPTPWCTTIDIELYEKNQDHGKNHLKDLTEKIMGRVLKTTMKNTCSEHRWVPLPAKVLNDTLIYDSTRMMVTSERTWTSRRSRRPRRSTRSSGVLAQRIKQEMIDA
eukprot:9018619-Heterocapsa_arctica.AAC.1